MSRSADPRLLRVYGTALWAFRKAVDFTQEELLDQAARLGLEAPNRTTISSLENGRKEAGLEMLFKLARALGLRPSVVLHASVTRQHSAPERYRRVGKAAGNCGRSLTAPRTPPAREWYAPATSNSRR